MKIYCIPLKGLLVYILWLLIIEQFVYGLISSQQRKNYPHHNIRDGVSNQQKKSSQYNRINNSNRNSLKYEEEIDLEIGISMNSDETENFFLNLDTFFPYNNFTIINVTLVDLQSDYSHNFKDNYKCQNLENQCIFNEIYQKINFYPQSPIVVEQTIDISKLNNTLAFNTVYQNDQITCPDQGINIKASKAPEDQPVHLFLSENNNLYVIIFDDTQRPVQQVATYSKDLNQYLDKDETLQCMNIEIYDLDAHTQKINMKNRLINKYKKKNYKKDKDDNDCYVFIDCNIIKQGDEGKQKFAMIFVVLNKDKNDIINQIGEISVKRYDIIDKDASQYFYTCSSRVIDNYSTMLIMYCPAVNNTQDSSNIIIMKNIQNGSDFPIEQDIIYIDSNKLLSSNCSDDASIYIKSLITNPLYVEPPEGQPPNNGWQFSFLLSDRICKCRLEQDNSTINCSSISLSDTNYHEMVYIQEQDVLTLFVGSDESIDEIQVGESMNDDGQNQIVGSLGIIEKDLILEKITVNSEYIMAQMRNINPQNKNKNGKIDIIVKVFSRTNENSFLHFYKQLESPVELFQNDNFYDMGNYIMIYFPQNCTLSVTRVTQKPLIISTVFDPSYKLNKTQNQIYKITGNYQILDEQQQFITQYQEALLFLELVPYSVSILNPRITSQQNTTWQQQTIDLSIKKGITGSLLYFMYEPSIQDDRFKSLIDYNQTIHVIGDFFVDKTIFKLELNDTNKLYNPRNYRAVVSNYSSPCIVEQYFCGIKSIEGVYQSDENCKINAKFNLTQYLFIGERCSIDTYCEGVDTVFIADKTQRIGFVCDLTYSKIDQENEVKCDRIIGEFMNSQTLINQTGNYQGYNTIVFFSYSSEQRQTQLNFYNSLIYQLICSKSK